jgi:hypothetical protein
LTLMIASVLPAAESAAQGKGPKPKSEGVLLPITGSTSTGGTFDGTFALQRFASSGSRAIVAVGVISGTVRTQAGGVVGTFFRGPVSLPVADPRPARRTRSTPAASSTTAMWYGDAPTPRFALAQVQQCGVLNLAIGAVDLNVLGLVVHTDPIALEVSGDEGGPLGALVCLVLNAAGTIVGLLNTILGLLGGLTGGLSV